jgi:hypothetical protein
MLLGRTARRYSASGRDPGAYCSAVYFSAGSRKRKDEHKRTVNLNYTHIPRHEARNHHSVRPTLKPIRCKNYAVLERFEPQQLLFQQCIVTASMPVPGTRISLSRVVQYPAVDVYEGMKESLLAFSGDKRLRFLSRMRFLTEKERSEGTEFPGKNQHDVVKDYERQTRCVKDAQSKPAQLLPLPHMIRKSWYCRQASGDPIRSKKVKMVAWSR